MPRKTRKQKERAQKRKEEEKLLNTETVFVKREFSFSENEIPGLQIKKSPIKGNDKTLPLPSVGTDSRDLLKTLVLAVIIFSLEVVLYFVWFKQARF